MDKGETEQLRSKVESIVNPENKPLWTISPDSTYVELKFVEKSKIKIQWFELIAIDTQLKNSDNNDIQDKFNTFYIPVVQLRSILVKLRDQGQPPMFARKIPLSRVKSMCETLSRIHINTSFSHQYLPNNLVWKLGREIERYGTPKPLDNFHISLDERCQGNLLKYNSYLQTGFQYVNENVHIMRNTIKEKKYIKVDYPYQVFSGYQNLPNYSKYCRILCRPGDRFKANMQLVNRIIGYQPVVFIHPETLAQDEIQSIKKLHNSWSEDTQQSICIVSSIDKNKLFDIKKEIEEKPPKPKIDFTKVRQKIYTNDIKDCVKMYIEDPEKSYQHRILHLLRKGTPILMTFSPELFKGNACPEIFDDLFLISMSKLMSRSGYNENGEYIDINNVFRKIIFEFPPNVPDTDYLSFIFDLNNLSFNWDTDLNIDNAFKIYRPEYFIEKNLEDINNKKENLLKLALEIDENLNREEIEKKLNNDDTFSRILGLIEDFNDERSKISALYAWNIIPDKYQGKDRMFIRIPDKFIRDKKYFRIGDFNQNLDNKYKLSENDVYKENNKFQEYISRNYIEIGLNDSIVKRLLKALLRVYHHQEVILVGNTGTGKTKISNVIITILSKIKENMRSKTINCNGATELLEVQAIVENIENNSKVLVNGKPKNYIIFVDEANTCRAGCYIAHKMRENFMNKDTNISYIVAANPLINSNEISKKLSLIGNKQFISIPTTSINFMESPGAETEIFLIDHFNYTYKVREIPEMIKFATIEYEIDINDEKEQDCMMKIIETELTKKNRDSRQAGDDFSVRLNQRELDKIRDCVWSLYKIIYNIIREKAAISYRNAIHFAQIFKLVYIQSEKDFDLALSVGIYLRFVLPYTTNAEFIDDKDCNFKIKDLKEYWNIQNFEDEFSQFLNTGFEKIDNIQEYLKNDENKMLNVDVQGYITHRANNILGFKIQEKMYEYSLAQCFKYIPEPKIMKLNCILFNLAALDIGYNLFHYLHELLPVLLIAKPGTAKSLAVEYFKKYHYSKEQDNFYCSTFLTGIISETSCLESHFYDCMRHQHLHEQYSAMVFLDELGFGNLNPNLYIKALHYIFDKGIYYKVGDHEEFEKIFPVGASNYQIDHAIMNRSVVISGSRPALEDLVRAFSLMKKQKKAQKETNSEEAIFFNSLTKELKYGYVRYNKSQLEKILNVEVDDAAKEFFNSIRKYINNSQSLMRPVFTIIMQYSDPIEIHYPIVVSSFISLGETFSKAVELTKEMWKRNFPKVDENYYEQPRFNNVLCLIKSLLLDHRLPRSLLFITENYESLPVVNEFLDVMFYFMKFKIIHLYENNFKQPRNIYANKSSLQICKHFMTEKSNEHSYIILIQGNNPSVDSNLDMINQQKPYSNPDDPSDNYNPFTHINGFSVHLLMKYMPRMHFLMVCNREDLANNIPLSMQDRLNAIILSFDDYINNFEEFINDQKSLTAREKDELFNKFEMFKYNAKKIRKFVKDDKGNYNHNLSDIFKYIKGDNKDNANIAKIYYTKEKIAITPQVNFYLKNILKVTTKMEVITPQTKEDLDNNLKKQEEVNKVFQFTKENIKVIHDLNNLKDHTVIFNGFNSQGEIYFYLNAKDDDYFNIGNELLQKNTEETAVILSQSIENTKMNNRKPNEDKSLRQMIIEYGKEHFTMNDIQKYIEQHHKNSDYQKVKSYELIENPAVDDQHLDLVRHIEEKKMCILVTNDYVNAFKFKYDAKLNIEFVPHEMVANETMLFNYIQSKNVVISISIQDHNELYHYTSLIEDFFNKKKCTNHVAIILQLKDTTIPDYVISTSKWPVYWIDTPSTNLEPNQISAINNQISAMKDEDKNFAPLFSYVLSYLTGKIGSFENGEKMDILKKFVMNYITKNAKAMKLKTEDIPNLNRRFIHHYCNTLEKFYEKFYFMLSQDQKFNKEIDLIKVTKGEMPFSSINYPTKRFILNMHENGIIIPPQDSNSPQDFASFSYLFCYILDNRERFTDEIDAIIRFLSPSLNSVIRDNNYISNKPEDFRKSGFQFNQIREFKIQWKIYDDNNDLENCFHEPNTGDVLPDLQITAADINIADEYFALKEKFKDKNPMTLIFNLFDHETLDGDREYTDPELFEMLKNYKGNFFIDMLNDFKKNQSPENAKFVNSFFLPENENHENIKLAKFICKNSQTSNIFQIHSADDEYIRLTKHSLMSIKSFISYYLLMTEKSPSKEKFLEVLEQFIKPSENKISKAERTQYIKKVNNYLEEWKRMFRCHLESLYILCASFSYNKLLDIKRELGSNMIVDFISDLENCDELDDFREYLDQNQSKINEPFKDQISSYLEELTKSYNLIRLVYNSRHENKEYIDLSEAKLNDLFFETVYKKFQENHILNENLYQLKDSFINTIDLAKSIVSGIVKQTSSFSYRFLDYDFNSCLSSSIATNLGLTSSLGFDDESEEFSKEILRQRCEMSDDQTNEVSDDQIKRMSDAHKCAVILLLMLVSDTETIIDATGKKVSIAKIVCYENDILIEKYLWTTKGDNLFSEVKICLMDPTKKIEEKPYFKQFKKIISKLYNFEIINSK